VPATRVRPTRASARRTSTSAISRPATTRRTRA
jgi:hypothetical protein